MTDGSNTTLFDIESTILMGSAKKAVTLIVDSTDRAEVLGNFEGTRRRIGIINPYDKLLECYEEGSSYIITHNLISSPIGLSLYDVLLGFMFKGKREVRVIERDDRVYAIRYGIIPEAAFIKIAKTIHWFKLFMLCSCVLGLLIILSLIIERNTYVFPVTALIFLLMIPFIAIIFFPSKAIKLVFAIFGYGDYVIYGKVRLGERLPEPRSVSKEQGIASTHRHKQ